MKGREYLLGGIRDGETVLSEIGVIAEKCWIEITYHFPFAGSDKHVIMPNHVHEIIIINKNGDGPAQSVEGQDF